MERYTKHCGGKRSCFRCLLDGGFVHRHDQGWVPFAGCAVVRLRGSGARRVETAFAGAPTQMVGRKKVWIVPGSAERAKQAVVVAYPAQDLLLLATDVDVMETLLRRRSDSATRVALRRDLAEWQNVDTSADVWCLRHYDTISANEDPTSPLNRNHQVTYADFKAIGMTVSVYPEEHKAVVKHISGSKDNSAIRKFWEGVPELKGTARVRGKGVFEVVLRWRDREDEGTLLYGVLALLGPGVLL